MTPRPSFWPTLLLTLTYLVYILSQRSESYGKVWKLRKPSKVVTTFEPSLHHKVVWQQIWGEVVHFIPAFSAVHLRMQQWKNKLKLANIWQNYCQNKKGALFNGPQCRNRQQRHGVELWSSVMGLKYCTHKHETKVLYTQTWWNLSSQMATFTKHSPLRYHGCDHRDLKWNSHQRYKLKAVTL